MADDTTSDAPATDGPTDAGTAGATTAAETEDVVRDEAREALLALFTDALGDAVVGSHILAGKDLWIRVSNEAWRSAADIARNRLGAKYFGFLSVIDWMPSPYGRSMDSEVDRRIAGDEPYSLPEGSFETGYAGGDTRFQVFARVAHINDPGATWGVTLKADLADESPSVESWTSVFAGADWHEREAWEMYGVDFVGHPGLRHMYLPTGFEGHPLRKDFPLVARQVKPWPGIVDVEQMPSDEDESSEDEAAPSDGTAAEGGES